MPFPLQVITGPVDIRIRGYSIQSDLYACTSTSDPVAPRAQVATARESLHPGPGTSSSGRSRHYVEPVVSTNTVRSYQVPVVIWQPGRRQFFRLQGPGPRSTDLKTWGRLDPSSRSISAARPEVKRRNAECNGRLVII
jgi:hypothetical protein